MKKLYRILICLILLMTSCRTLSVSVKQPTPSLERLQTPTAAAVPLPEPTALPTPTSSPTMPASSFRLVAYYPYWSLSTRQYRVEDIPAASLTHINYAFAVLSMDGECTSANADADAVNLPALQALKLRYPHLQTLLSVGGSGTGKAFSQAAGDAASRDRLVESCVTFMLANGFDGIDLDWEFPQDGETQAFTDLLSALRQRLDTQGQADGRRYLLTIAAPAGPWQMARIDFPQVVPLLDWLNLMTYDYYGSWSSSTGFNAPLYPSTPDPAHLSVDTTVQAYLAAGVPAEKLVVGLPFFGRGWQGVADTNHGLYQPFSAPAQGTGKGSYDFYFIQENLLGQYARYWDDEARVPWLYDPAQGIMVSYDDAESILIKAAYIRQHALGGAMIWQIAADDSAGSLLQAVLQGLQP
jgi:chitinase